MDSNISSINTNICHQGIIIIVHHPDLFRSCNLLIVAKIIKTQTMAKHDIAKSLSTLYHAPIPRNVAIDV